MGLRQVQQKPQETSNRKVSACHYDTRDGTSEGSVHTLLEMFAFCCCVFGLEHVKMRLLLNDVAPMLLF